ncbi:MAG: 30S ribosomal protein S1 [Phycisphaerae bacterium]|nr:30S ribosomal protein S1 [Phycisphaerae bacterium]
MADIPRPSEQEELEREIADALGDISLADMTMLSGDAPARPVDSGGKIKGRILRVTPGYVFVDVGGKSEGIISIDEFPPDRPPAIGEEMSFISHGVDRESGMLKLSQREILLEASWDSLTPGAVVEGRVTGVNRGGLELNVNGLRAFMPASQVDIHRVDDVSLLINHKLECEVVEVKPSDQNLLVSRRRLLERRRAEAREQLKYTLREGQVREGIVRRLMDFGAFVDLGGVDGLLHVKDISYGRVKHPSEVLKPGDKVSVTVLKIDLVTDRIALGLKQLQTDPWTLVPARYAPGQNVHGRVLKLMNFGAFVELEPGIEGLIPISEMSHTKRLHHPNQLLKEGDSVEAQIMELDAEKHRMSLSLKRLSADPWHTVAERYRPDEMVSGVVMRTTEFGAFVQLEEGVDGLVHISELSDRRIRAVTDVVKPGQVVSVRVLSVDPENRRVSLSMKAHAAPTSHEHAAAHGHAASHEHPTADHPPPHTERKRKRPLRGGLD